ncbi:DNA-binding transcriptional MerR regulator [Okibacterium sp. HSC-33S16]|uniref:MerR family transcriptional regulator n=1 Tax=Okibacterium sp. HSC-33S16 TaxID=2910965 RepID=UPI0020A0353E|nr:MerR family transcriptional regulator [Okibacterium sp. HSC-33S16]MCP2031500.1 DNA-binding transcriptional MerR regulator [Okibacterium sp. HSC-33S16]
MEWSIQDIAKHASTTSRTLRHYDEIGLLRPTRVGSNGYRYYNAAALVTLQRILLLRDLGLGLPAIADVLNHATDATGALRTHLTWLQKEQDRLGRQAVSVRKTIEQLEKGEEPMADKMFDGFDHTQYKGEVEERWGKDAYAHSDSWWRSMSDSEKAEWQAQLAALNSDWIAASEAGIHPDSEDAQMLARRHVTWLTSIPGTPAAVKEYVTGLGDMYVADERFAANYGGADGAEFVRDALAIYADRNL